jgi:uncharacterized protein (TIGR02145 family)
MVDNLRYGGSDSSSGIVNDYCAGRTDFFGEGNPSTNANWYASANGEGTADNLYGDCRDPAATGNGTVVAPCLKSTICGYYYNWQATTQNADAYYNGAAQPPTVGTQGICPAGWHVPTGGSSGDFYALDDANGGGSGGSCNSSDAPCAFWLPGGNWRGVRAGICLNSGSLNNQGNYGYYSSSSWYSTSTTSAYCMFSISNSLGLSTTNNRDRGMPVRCVQEGLFAPATITIPATIYTGQGQTVTVSWASSTNATGYILEGKCGTGEYIELYNGPNLTFDNDITGCTTSIQYRVKAYDTVVSVASRYKESDSHDVIPLYCEIQGSSGTMQDWDGCAALATPAALGYIQGPCLTDTRDGKVYEVRKFADGKCWMVDNLRYGGDTTTTGDGCAGKNTFAPLSSNMSGASWGYGECGDPAILAKNPPCNNTTDCGYFYNWQAAMQDASAYLNNNYTGPTGIVQGICPAGWHLPQGGSSSEFHALDYANGGDGSNRGCDDSDALCAFWRPGYNWKGIYSCYMYPGEIHGCGAYGYWWSSGQRSVGLSYSIRTSTNYHQGGTASENKNQGLTVRCIKN